MNEDEIKIRAREEKLAGKWDGINSNVTVNNQQYSFDSPKRQEEFVQSQFSDPEVRKQYDHYREEWFRRAKQMDPGSAPLAVCCELVSTCNLNCSMCYTITEEFQGAAVGSQRMLPWSTVKRIIDECAEVGVASMLFSWRGESTMYRSRTEDGKIVTFPDVLSYARKQGILEITSLTNGQMMDEAMIRGIVEAEPNWISFSVDGLENFYNKIRTPSNKAGKDYNAFELVVRNIKALAARRDAMGKKRPQIRTNSIYPPIATDPRGYHDFMESIGVGWVTVNELLDMRGEQLPDEAVLKDWVCQYPFQRLTISSNGCILPCTGAHNEEEDMIIGRYVGSQPKESTVKGVKKIANHREMTLKEAWHSPELENIRLLHRENRRTELFACKHCRHGAVKHGVTWIPEDWDMETMEWKSGVWRE